MKKIDNSYIELVEISEIQKVLRYMLTEFDKLCNANNILYCAFGGTFLGAIRHKDFIPWDDDVDVCVPKNDFNKLIEAINKSNIFYLKQNSSTGIFPYMKIFLNDSILNFPNIKDRYNCMSMFIDVFPVYEYPTKHDNLFFNLLKVNNHCRDYSIYKLSYVMKSDVSIVLKTLKFIAWIICSICGPRFFSKIEYTILNKFKNKDYYLLYGAGWGTKGKIQKEIFNKKRRYKFGNINIYGIIQYDKLLNNLYGDYMTIPKNIERKHNYYLYIKDTLYNYINKTTD